MSNNLKTVIEFIESNPDIPSDQKEALLSELNAAKKESAILEFKLDRTEKVKRTTAILLEETIDELEQKRTAVEEALMELKATQDQLIQQEKLASLGQLTAGIAHEIKNPLNFVNNFSELSVELVEEIRHEIRELRDEIEGEMSNVKGEKGTPLSRGVLILEILNDIEANLKTIHKHGSRADSIVKSMLQHSRGGDGKMEPTPLNPLIKEYVNLAFHGMRAGKEPINVDIDLQLDDGVDEVPLIAEDFSRVILNLVNNAFDAMHEKTLQGFQTLGGLEKDSPLEGSADHESFREKRGVSSSGEYKPKLTVRTHQNDQSVTIDIEDNGPGIPDEMKDKIMQPFFTTKKGTEGTGLGLSITNDIIKAHGGRLDTKSLPGKNTTFTIHLEKQRQDGF